MKTITTIIRRNNGKESSHHYKNFEQGANRHRGITAKSIDILLTNLQTSDDFKEAIEALEVIAPIVSKNKL